MFSIVLTILVIMSLARTSKYIDYNKEICVALYEHILEYVSDNILIYAGKSN